MNDYRNELSEQHEKIDEYMDILVDIREQIKGNTIDMDMLADEIEDLQDELWEKEGKLEDLGKETASLEKEEDKYDRLIDEVATYIGELMEESGEAYVKPAEFDDQGGRQIELF